MFENLGDLISTGLGVLALASLAGVGLMRGTVSNLRDTLADLRKDLEDTDRRLALEKAAREAAEEKVTQRDGELAALVKNLTGDTHWVAIGNTLDQHHAEAMQHWTTDEAILIEIRDLLRSQR